MTSRSGWPAAFHASRTSLIAVSVPSEPPFVKKTFGRPERRASRAASRIAGSFEKSQNEA